MKKKSNEMSEEDFDKLMNPPLSPEQIRASELKNAFINKMKAPMRIVIKDVYGKDAMTPAIENALEKLGQIVYLESTK